MIVGAAFVAAVLMTVTLEPDLRASTLAGAFANAPVLINPGNQTNTDSSSYEQAVRADAPAGYWRLDDTTNVSIADSVGAHVGVSAGAVTLNRPGALADGNTAMQFDGADATKISIPGSAALAAIDGSSAITMEAWINPQTLTLPSKFQMFFSFPGNPASYLGVSTSTGALKVIGALWIGGAQRHIAVGPTLAVGSWYHTVATYDGGRLTLYVNGEAVGQITGLSGAVSLGSVGLLLGGHPTPGHGFGFNGLVDEAAVYDYALSPAQIATHYARRATGGSSVALQLSASDADGDVLTYGASGLPAPLDIDPATGLISGTLTASSAGVHDVSVTASDGQLAHSQTFTWTVTHVNRAPIVANPGNQISRATTGASLQPAASDADTDPLTYSAVGLPPSLTIDPGTGLVSGTPPTTDVGAYLVTLTVSDGFASDSQTFTWTVTHPNRAPVLANPGDQTTAARTATYVDAVTSDGPVGYWRLGEAAGPGVADSAGINAGQSAGGVIAGQPGALADDTTSMQFDGLDGSRVFIPSTAALAAINGSTAITMEAWINPQSSVLPSRFRMFYSFPGVPASYLGITDAFGGLKIIAALWIDGRQRYLAMGPTLTVGAWYHIVATYDGALLTLYVNGSAVGQITGLSGALSIGTGGVILGGHPTPGYSYSFNGLVDDAAIYKHALTPTQVARHYARAASEGADIRLQLSASDPDGNAVTFSATGLPSPLAIDPATGLISGTLNADHVGTYDVTVTVSDGQHSHTQTFVWWVTDKITYSDAIRGEAPVGYWRLGETAGTDVADSAGSSPGVRVGGVTAGQPGALADGNTSMHFDGLDGSKVGIPNTPALAAINGSSAMTIEAWINPSTSVLPSRFRMFYSFPGVPASYLGITDAFGGLRIIGALWINGRQRYVALGPTLTVGSWYHAVVTYDGSQMTLFVNGSAAGQITGLSGPVSIGTGGVTLGGHPTQGLSFGFDGRVDDAAIYNYALSPAQIARHYALRRSAPISALTVTSNPEVTAPVGQTVTFTANATGGTAPLELKWFVYTSRTGWTMARDWSTSASFQWTPAFPDTWSQVTVWARSAGDPADAPEKSADAPFPVFVTGETTTARLLAQEGVGAGHLDLLKPITWTSIPSAQAYALQIGSTPGGAEVLYSGLMLGTVYDASGVAGLLPRPAVAWDADETGFTFSAYAMMLDDERTDFGYLLPTTCRIGTGEAPCYRMDLPALGAGGHSLAVSAYNAAGESWSSPVMTTGPTDNDLFVRLWTKLGGVWRYVDSQLTVQHITASFIYPLPNAVRVKVTKPIRWSPVSGAEAYSLTIGRTEGADDLVSIPETQETSHLAPALPGGVTLYARLGTKFAGVWRYTEATFVARASFAQLEYPAAGEVLVPQTARFSWSLVPDAEAYSLEVGRSLGTNDLASSGELQERSYDVLNLPPATVLFARLGTRENGVWHYEDTTFTTAAVPGYGPLSQFITPTDGAEVGTDSIEFRWTEVPAVLGYHLHVGTTPGDDRLGMSPDYTPETRYTVEALPRGVLLYARLYTQYYVGDWEHYVDIFFTIPAIP